MSQEIKGKHLHIKFEEAAIQELDRISERIGLKRADVVRKLVDLGMDVFRGYERIGLVKIIEIKNRTKKAVKEETQPSLFKV